jgi:hypothetical protein
VRATCYIDLCTPLYRPFMLCILGSYFPIKVSPTSSIIDCCTTIYLLATKMATPLQLLIFNIQLFARAGHGHAVQICAEIQYQHGDRKQECVSFCTEAKGPIKRTSLWFILVSKTEATNRNGMNSITPEFPLRRKVPNHNRYIFPVSTCPLTLFLRAC